MPRWKFCFSWDAALSFDVTQVVLQVFFLWITVFCADKLHQGDVHSLFCASYDIAEFHSNFTYQLWILIKTYKELLRRNKRLHILLLSGHYVTSWGRSSRSEQGHSSRAR